MFSAYAGKPFNREAKVLALNSPFSFEIRPARTTYLFEGWVDQVLEIRTESLITEFPTYFHTVSKPTVMIHRRIKFGQRRQISPFELALNIELDVLAYALKQGTFFHPLGDIDPRPGRMRFSWDLIPDFHAVYFLRDHIPYKDDSGTYIRDESGNYIECDLVAEPCLLGKKGEPCKGKRTRCTKMPRGPGMFFTERPEDRIRSIPRELMPVCAAIRVGHYPRQPGELCASYCGFRSACEAEVGADKEAA